MSLSRRHILPGLVIAALGVTLSPRSANACSPAMPPPRRPGETDADLKARMEGEWLALQRSNQEGYWARADQVFLARRVEPDDPPPLPERPYDPRRDGPPRPPERVRPSRELVSVFQPLRALKGALPADRFELRYEIGGGACGPFTLRDALYSEIGDVIVVFQKGARSQQENLLEAIKPENILDPRIRALLGDAP